MSYKNLRNICLSGIVLISGCLTVNAAPVVKARLDSAGIMMGDLTNLELTIEQPENMRGHLPLFKDVMQKGYVGVCGDSVELRAPVKSDTIREGRNLKIRYDIPVQCFDSGRYVLPRIEFVAGVDTFRSNVLELKVFPVSGVTADTPIADYANVADPENPSIFDTLPDWLVRYWWILLVIVALAVFGFYLWKRYKRDGYILPKKPEPTPYEAAISALKQLKEKKLWENGLEKEYFTELTDILRIYLYRRFGINAMEMTSRQILAALSSNKDTKEQRPKIRQILDMADFVKFAKVRPLPADNVASFDNAVKFIEETKPVENPASEVDEKKNEVGEKKMKETKKGGEK